MNKFEDKNFTGVFAEYLNNCKPYRIEAIYNAEFRYIKEIIWDTEAEEKFGKTREGYKKFKNDEEYQCNVSINDVYLRTRHDRYGNILGYITETKRTSNDDYNIVYKQYEDAKEKLMELLNVKDKETFLYWLDSETSVGTCVNGIISSIQNLESIYKEYNEDEEFKRFFDKIVK